MKFIKKNLYFFFVGVFILFIILTYFFVLKSISYNLIFFEEQKVENNKVYYYGYLNQISSNVYNHSSTPNEALKNSDLFRGFMLKPNNYLDNLELFKEVNNEEDKIDLIKEYETKFGKNNKNLNKIKNKKHFLFYHTYKLFEFNNSFNKDKKGEFWGINKKSNSLLSQQIKINYVKNNSYSVSIFDKNNNEIIFMKKDNNIKTYKDYYNFYLDNKNDLNEFVLGEDSLIVKNIKIEEDNSKVKFEGLKYYISLDFRINGYSPNEIDVNNYLSLDDTYNFDFRKNTLIFIKDVNDKTPYFIYSY